MTKFKEFIRNFEIEQNCFPYNEALLDNPTRLLVHLEDIHAFDSDLPSLIRSAPADFLPVFEKAAGEVLAGLKMREANETGEMEEPSPSDVDRYHRRYYRKRKKKLKNKKIAGKRIGGRVN